LRFKFRDRCLHQPERIHHQAVERRLVLFLTLRIAKRRILRKYLEAVLKQDIDRRRADEIQGDSD